MCLSMKVIGNGNLMFILGIIIGIIGSACMGVNYPIYKKMFKHIFSPAMDMYSISNEEKTYIAAFYINGMIAVVKEWLQNDCKMSEEHICDIILKCVNTSN